MNRNFTVYRRLKTTEAPEVIFDAVEQSLRTYVGGSVARYGNTIRVDNGTKNLNFEFAADISADIVLTQPSPGVVDMNGTITLKPNTIFWLCAVAGFFCLIVTWVVNVFYFVMDPRPNYQTALDRVDQYLSSTASTPFGGH